MIPISVPPTSSVVDVISYTYINMTPLVGGRFKVFYWTDAIPVTQTTVSKYYGLTYADIVGLNRSHMKYTLHIAFKYSFQATAQD